MIGCPHPRPGFAGMMDMFGGGDSDSGPSVPVITPRKARIIARAQRSDASAARRDDRVLAGRRQQTSRIAIVGGSILLLGVVAFLFTRKGKS